MRAVVMKWFGDADGLVIEDVTTPTPPPGWVVVRVGAVEVSRTRDVATRSGRHPFSQAVRLPHILGGDFAGIVHAVGAEVDREWIGLRVAVSNGIACGQCTACQAGAPQACGALRMIGIHLPGSYAEFAIAPVANLSAIPNELSLTAAAALVATGPIAAMQLRAAGVTSGQWILVPGASGALSSVVIGLAARRGYRVVGLSRDTDRAELAELGIPILQSTRSDLASALHEMTAGAGIAAVIDNVASPGVFQRYLPALSRGGRVVISGAIGTPELPVLAVPAAHLYINSQSLIGVRSPDAPAIDGFWEEVRRGFRLPEGVVRIYDAREAVAAHRAVEAGRQVGHIVLELGEKL